MADNASSAAETAPAISQGQTTSVGENTQALQEVPSEPGAPAAAEEAQPSLFSSPWFYAAAAVWLWWLFGNKKRRAAKANEKKERERRDTLQKGDNIVTIGRMHGRVIAFTDDSVTIKPDPKADYTMTFDRQAIFRVLPRPGEGAEAAPETGK